MSSCPLPVWTTGSATSFPSAASSSTISTMEHTAFRVASAFGIVFEKEPTRDENETQLTVTHVFWRPMREGNKKRKPKTTNTRPSYNGPPVTGGKPKNQTLATRLIQSRSFTRCASCWAGCRKNTSPSNTYVHIVGRPTQKKKNKNLFTSVTPLAATFLSLQLGVCHNSWFWSMHVSLGTGTSASSGMGKDFPRCMLR